MTSTRMVHTAGTAEPVLSEIDGLVPDAHLGGQCLAVVATADGVLHVEHFDEVPLVEWRQSSPAHVVVTVDRRGADVVGFRREAPDVVREAVWETNAADVAAEVVKVAERIGARVIGVAGDVRAVALLRNELPRQWADVVTVLEGDISDAIVRAVADVVARDTVAVLEKFREELGQSDRAVEGCQETAEALAKSQVEMLLVHDEGDVDEFVRAAFATSSGIRVVPKGGGPADGVGAVLRWS